MFLFCLFPKHFPDFLFLQKCDTRDVFFDNPGFCLCNLPQTAAKNCGVIHTDGGNNTENFCIRYICRIEFPAQSTLDHGSIAIFFCKPQISKCRFHLKNSRKPVLFCRPFYRRFHFLHLSGKLMFGYLFSIYANVFQFFKNCW